MRTTRAALLENFIVRRDYLSASRARNFGRISRACLNKSCDSLSFVLMPPPGQFVWILEALQSGIRRNVLISLMNLRGYSQKKKVSLNAPSAFVLNTNCVVKVLSFENSPTVRAPSKEILIFIINATLIFWTTFSLSSRAFSILWNYTNWSNLQVKV